MYKLLLVVFVIGLASASPINPNDDRMIVGGFQTSIEENPWQVSLQVYSSHNCGGSIISKNWVLTAGHCASSGSTAYTVRVGSSRYASGGSIVRVKKVFRHEKYNASITDFDFSLLELAEPLTFNTTIQSIQLANEDTKIADGADALVSGWGATHNSSESNAVIRGAYVPIANQKYCNDQYQSFGRPITDRMICAGFEQGGKDSCQGDSGGPLSIESGGARVLVGVVSWGYGCAQPRYPGVYGRVSSVRSWIKNISGV